MLTKYYPCQPRNYNGVCRTWYSAWLLKSNVSTTGSCFTYRCRSNSCRIFVRNWATGMFKEYMVAISGACKDASLTLLPTTYHNHDQPLTIVHAKLIFQKTWLNEARNNLRIESIAYSFAELVPSHLPILRLLQQLALFLALSHSNWLTRRGPLRQKGWIDHHCVGMCCGMSSPMVVAAAKLDWRPGSRSRASYSRKGQAEKYHGAQLDFHPATNCFITKHSLHLTTFPADKESPTISLFILSSPLPQSKCQPFATPRSARLLPRASLISKMIFWSLATRWRTPKMRRLTTYPSTRSTGPSSKYRIKGVDMCMSYTTRRRLSASNCTTGYWRMAMRMLCWSPNGRRLDMRRYVYSVPLFRWREMSCGHGFKDFS